jgi:hypothetical protein
MTPGARKVRRKARDGNTLTAPARGAYKSRSKTFYGDDSTVIDPAEVLLQEIRRTAGHIEWLREQIQLSDPTTFVKSLWLVRRQSGYINPREIDLSAFSDAGSLWVDLYLAERKHLAAICRTALAAGIEERRVRLAERQAENLGRAIIGMLGDLGIDAEAEEVRSTVYRWLILATTGGEPESNKVLPIEGKVLGSD